MLERRLSNRVKSHSSRRMRHKILLALAVRYPLEAHPWVIMIWLLAVCFSIGKMVLMEECKYTRMNRCEVRKVAILPENGDASILMRSARISNGVSIGDGRHDRSRRLGLACC